MAEKIASDLSDLALEENVELCNGEDFLEALNNKVRQLEEILDVECRADTKLLFFSIETKRNDEPFARKLIDLIDRFTYEFFFSKI